VVCVHGEIVPALPLAQIIEEFISWFIQNEMEKCIFIAHNGRRFDLTILVNALTNIHMLDKFTNHVFAFVDSLQVLQKKLPGKDSYKEEVLVKDLLDTSYGAHDVLEDVKALSQVLDAAQVTKHYIQTLSSSSSAVHHQQQYVCEKTNNLPSLQPLLANGIIKMPTAENIAG
jgi:DNA polymerase III epsilon subunit-like protein